MHPDRDDYADPPGPPLALRELAWALALFLAPPLLLILCCVISSLGY